MFNWFIDLDDRLFANEQGDRSSIPGRVIPKTQKIALDASLINTQHVSRVKWNSPRIQGKELSSPTPRCSS